MRLLLSEALPLRTTRMLGDYAEAQALPEILGDLADAAFPLIRLSATRYFVADHPATVRRVYIDGQLSAAWEAKLESDDAGNTWTVVVFDTPIAAAAKVSATGAGRLNAATGALITNPADALARVSAIAGRPDDWSNLRAECSRLNITVAGRLATAQSVRAQIDEIAQSIGAIWVPGMARLYPSTDDPAPVVDLEAGQVSGVAVSASVRDTADVLRLSYDYSDARGKPLHYIELAASPARYGGVPLEQTAAWLRTPQCAETVGRARLQRLAGERYDVQFTSDMHALRPGMWVRLVAHPAWPLPGDDPVIMVLAVDITGNRAQLAVTGEYLASVPVITIAGHSIALPDEVEAGLAVTVSHGVATFTLTDDEGKPIVGAAVSLDGSAPKYTNAQGQVSFVAAAGVHKFAAEAVGFLPFELFVTL